jgi:hypothetical protein
MAYVYLSKNLHFFTFRILYAFILFELQIVKNQSAEIIDAPI